MSGERSAPPAGVVFENACRGLSDAQFFFTPWSCATQLVNVPRTRTLSEPLVQLGAVIEHRRRLTTHLARSPRITSCPRERSLHSPNHTRDEVAGYDTRTRFSERRLQLH